MTSVQKYVDKEVILIEIVNYLHVTIRIEDFLPILQIMRSDRGQFRISVPRETTTVRLAGITSTSIIFKTLCISLFLTYLIYPRFVLSIY